MQTYYQFYWNKIDEESIRILRIFGESEDVIVPETIGGRAVMEAGDYCFAASKHLPSEYECTVCIYDTEEKKWQEIPADGADWNTRLVELSGDRLKKVTLPDNMHKVGNYAFYNCTALEMLVTGKYLEEIGSDAFMNCKKFHFLTVRCDVGERSGANQILSRISADMEVTFQGKTGQTAVFYPEYYESYDEIGPAHIFELNLTGEGFRARQCFKEGVILLNAYDEIFPQACVEESAEVLIPMAWNRLYAACGLSPEARAAYETYVREQSGKVLTILLKKRELKPLHFFFEKGYGRKEQIEDAVAIASHEEWMEGVASLIAWKRQLFAEQTETADVRSRYVFEEF